MKKDIVTILKSMKEVSLGEKHKTEIKKHLLDHIGAPSHTTSSTNWYGLLWSHQFKVGYAALFITLSLGSTVVFAAEQALPGDLFYPVKTKVTERVERVFVASEPEPQAEYETKLVERRLQEAERLDREEEFEERTKKIAKEEIEKQADKAEQALAKVKIVRESKKNEESIQLMGTFSAPQATEMMSAKMNVRQDIDDDDNSDDKEDRDSRDDSRKARNSDDNDDNDNDDDRDSDLRKVFERHEDIVKKLDIKKNNRSREDR
ncbi:MAG: hypothetical protein QG640_672 [Patescibacteria group bacterium]|nr:hypothetical protein [Patescibacteria group bacterium]